MEQEIHDIKTILAFLLKRDVEVKLSEAEKIIVTGAMKRLQLIK